MPFFPSPFPVWGNSNEDNNGNPLAGGKLFTYAAGTSTPLATYTDSTGGTPNANPVVLDQFGRANIWQQDGVGYKFVLQDSLGNTLWTADNVMVPQVQQAAAPSNIPSGGIIMYGANAAPTGYLVCDGSAVSRSTYATLFGIIGTTYGAGNGSTTFNLPDMRQRFPMGLAPSGTGSILGGTGGTVDHVHTGPSHTHTVAAHTHTVPAHAHTVPRDGWGSVLNTPGITGRVQTGNAAGVGADASEYQATTDNTSSNSAVLTTSATALTSDPSGTGNTGTANPPFQTVVFIIKT